MFSKSKYFNQSTIINNYNLLVTALDKAGYKKLLPLPNEGSCNGLSFCYKFYAHQGKRESFILVLQYLANLKK